MGVDVVEIGLRHRLSVDNRKKLAQELATILNMNVKIVARKEFVYDKSVHMIADYDDYDVIPLEEYIIKESNNYLEVFCSNYQKNFIKESLGKDKVRTLKFDSPDTRRSFFELDDTTMYEAETRNREDDYIYFDIYKENIVLPYYVCSRWFNFIREFKDPQSLCYLKETRKDVYEQAKMFGCDSVIYCSDGTPSSRIWDSADIPSSELLTYASTGEFLKPGKGVNFEKKYHKARVIYFSDFFAGKVKLDEDEFVEAIIDDFKDMQ